MPESAIRPAAATDGPLLRAITRAAYAHWVPLIGRRPAPMDEDHDGQCRAGEAWFHDNRAAIVLRDEAPGLLLDNIAVLPEAQGAGLGRSLILFAEAEARRRGHGTLWLYTNEKMAPNIALYARLGFRETHRAGEPPMRRVFMEKPV